MNPYIEKARALPIGTRKTYGGKPYVKTAEGWKLEKKGRNASTAQSPSEVPQKIDHSDHIKHIVDDTTSKSDKIRKLHALGLPKAEIAKHVGAHYSQVHGIVKNATAKEEKGPISIKQPKKRKEKIYLV